MRSKKKIIYADLDEMIFENKAYGGFKLRKDSDLLLLQIFVVIAGILVLSLVLISALKPEQPQQSPDKEPVRFAWIPASSYNPRIETRETKSDQKAVPTASTEAEEENSYSLNNEEHISGTQIVQEIPGKRVQVHTDLVKVRRNDANMPGGSISENGSHGTAPILHNLQEFKSGIEYPHIMKMLKIEGDLLVKIMYDSTGTITGHEILKSAHPVFTKTILKDIQSLELTPGVYRGKSMGGHFIIPFQFRLNGQE